MAKRRENDLSGLRKTVAAYVKGMIGLGLAAQTLSSAGGSYLAISRLISSGVALASQLQRGIVVRVVGAPLVTRRPRRRSRGGGSEEYPEPSVSTGEGASARDQEATEWEEVVPPSIAVAEIDSQPFSLARMLPSMVAAQQSTFRAISSVKAAVARAVGTTGFSPISSRVSPSETSLEQPPRGRPDAFPENQATSFAGEPPALALVAAFRGAASSMFFNLSSAAQATTNIALGSQAVGATFASRQSRAANEGTGFLPSSQAPTSPSLLEQSITGSADTAFRSAAPLGANLGLSPGAGGSPSSQSAAPSASSSSLPVTREAVAPSDLAAQVGGPSAGGSPGGGPSVTQSSGPGVELSAGPYVVPNGFNSVLSSPAFAAGSQLSMQVRSLASSGLSGSLPLRSSQEPSPEEGGSSAMAVVPEQYPSSYPAGAAYSVSRIVASLGLGQAAPSSAEGLAQAETGGKLTTDEAPGIEQATQTVGGAFVGEPPEGRGSVTAGTSVSPAETSQGRAQLDVEEGPAGASARTGFVSDTEPGVSREALFPFPQHFGERWTMSIAAAAGVGSALMGMLSVSGAASSPGRWTPAAAVAYAGGQRAPLGEPAQSRASPGLEASGSEALPRQTYVAGTAILPEQARSPGSSARSDRRPEATRQDIGPLILVSQTRQEQQPTAQPRHLADLPDSRAGVAPSVWEAATLLPGILTPYPATQLAASGSVQSQVAHGPVPATSEVRTRADLPLGAGGPSAVGYEALRVATSLRTALLEASGTLVGAKTAGFPAPTAAGASRPEPVIEGLALAERSPGTFVRVGRSGLARRVDRFGLDRAQARGVHQESTPAPPPAIAYLPALQAALASRAMLAAGVTRSASIPSSLPTEAAGGQRTPAGFGPPAQPAPSAPARTSPPAEPATAEGELEEASSRQPGEARGGADAVFFGLEAISQALSVAARLPSAAHMTGSFAIAPPRRGIQAGSAAAPRQLARGAPAEVRYALEEPARPLDTWRSAPEEAIARMLGEQPRQPAPPSPDVSQEPDERELRRKIEKMIDEELRRYGYQP